MRSVFPVLLLLIAIQVLVSLAVLSIPVLVPGAGTAMGLTTSSLGYFVALVFLAAMAGGILFAEDIIRLGAIRVSQACLALCALGLACVASGFPILVWGGALLLGLGYGPVTPASSHLLAQRVPAGQRSFAFSLKQTGVPAGNAAAGLFLPGLMIVLGWQGSLLTVAALCVFLAVLLEVRHRWSDGGRGPGVSSSVRPPRSSRRRFRPQPERLLAPLRLVLTYPRLRELALASLLFAGLQGCLSAYLVDYLKGGAGLDHVLAGYCLAATQIAGIGGRILWGAVCDRLGSARLMLAGLGFASVVSMGLLLMGAHNWPLLALILVCALLGASATGWNGVFLAEVARLAPIGDAARATGGALAATYMGIMLGPLLFSVLYNLSGHYEVSFIVLALLVLLPAIVMVLPSSHSVAEGQP